MNPWKRNTPIHERLQAMSRPNAATGCVEWQGSTNGRYGTIYFNRRWFVHRLAYTLSKGTIPDGLMVCHHCDNPLCLNPDHLFTGTGEDNMQDCVRKGRIQDQKGEKNNKAKLDWPRVRMIREMIAAGWTNKSIAEQFGVVRHTISGIKHGRTWREAACS